MNILQKIGSLVVPSSVDNQAKNIDPFDLQRPLVDFGGGDTWTIGDACEGVQIFGSTGSGKTSGSGKQLAYSFLEAGFGGLILTAKKDERETWERYCEETGRELYIFGVGEPWRFNFLEYELFRDGSGAGRTDNLVELFFTIIELAVSAKETSDPYWHHAGKQLVRNAIELIKLSGQPLTLKQLYNLIISAPKTHKEVMSLKEMAGNADQSVFMQCLIGCEQNRPQLSWSQQEDLDLTISYWLQDFVSLADKTRSIIINGFTALADPFLRGDMRDLFCTDLTIAPEFTHHHGLLLVDLCVFEYGEVGRYAQVLMKYIWQQATMRRTGGPGTIPTFLWADESQFFVNDKDAKFQSVARSARACTVYLTQNLPNYYAQMGDYAGVKGLLGNLKTKIFHNNDDVETNGWASELIGKETQTRYSSSTSSPKNKEVNQLEVNRSMTTSQVVEYQVRPEAFTTLKQGGQENSNTVSGILFKSGKVWKASNRAYRHVDFRQ